VCSSDLGHRFGSSSKQCSANPVAGCWPTFRE
jgi:hypothetical protein